MSVKTFLFPRTIKEANTSFALLLMRLAIGGMFMTHGWAKLTNFDATAASFEQMGMGGTVGAALAVFAEFFCGLGIVTGTLFRLALIPPIITMCMAFFAVHAGNPMEGELALIYLIVFVAMMIIGPGKYSVDRFVANRLI